MNLFVNKNFPALRFQQFSDKWVKSKLSKFSEKISDGIHSTPKYNDAGNYFFVNGNNLIGGKITISNKTKKVDSIEFEKHKRILNNRTILLSINGTIGNIALYNNEPIILGKSACYINLNELILRDFMFQYIGTDKIKRYFTSQLTGSTIMNLSLKAIKDTPLKLPSVSEQQKIAEFLSSVDKKIQLLEKKKEQLALYKKGVMQKIFSREIRFKDDNGNTYPDWERSVLADLFSSKRGQGLSGKNIIEDGKNKCILYGALYTKYDEVIFDVVEKTNEIGSVQSVMGDLLVPASTTTSGIDLANFTALDEDGIYLGGDITIMRSKEKSSNKFWAYYLTHFKKFDVAKYAQGTTIVHLYFNHFKKIKVDVPSYDEQKKIAGFILVIDKKIKSTSTQIDKTKEFKKGLLQQMFV